MAMPQQPAPNPNAAPAAPRTFDERLADFINDPNSPQTTAELLDATNEARTAFASAIADTSAATFNGHTGALDTARENYLMHYGALSLDAYSQIKADIDSGTGSAAAKATRLETAVREFSALSVLGAGVAPTPAGATAGTGNTLTQVTTTQPSEAALLAEQVANQRLMKAGFQDAQGNERKGMRGLYNKFTRKWSEWGFIKKTAATVAVGALATVGVIGGLGLAAGGGAALAAAGAIQVSKSAASAHLKNRGNVTRAVDENNATIRRVVGQHDATEVVGIEELAGGFHGAARNKLTKNRRRAAIGAVVTAGAIVGGDLLHGAATGLFDRAGHDTEGAFDGAKSWFEHVTGLGHHVSTPAHSGSSHGTSSGKSGSTGKGTGHNRAPAGSKGNQPPAGSQTPETPVTTHQAYEHFGVHETNEVTRTWATGTNANEMTHYEDIHGGIIIHLSDIHAHETVLNGHSLKDLRGNPNLKIAVTIDTQEGPKMIFASMHDGKVPLTGAFGEAVKEGNVKTLEVVLQQGDSEHLQVLSTVVGHQTEPVSNAAFNGILHSSHEVVASHVAPSHHGDLTEAQFKAAEAYDTRLYEAYAQIHPGASRADFATAFANGLKHGQIEVQANAHATGFQSLVPDAHLHDAAWQNASAHQAAEALGAHSPEYVPVSAEVHAYQDQLYEAYVAQGHNHISRAAFDKALETALKDHEFDVKVNANGTAFQALVPDPRFADQAVWQHVPVHQIVEMISKKQGAFQLAA